MYKGILLAFVVLFAGVASAQDRDARVDVNGGFAVQQQKIMAALDDGKSYSEIGKAEREKVVAALARIGTALQHAGSVENLSKEQKVAVFNDQELANAILTRAGEDSRLVCKRTMATGTHRTTTQCMTVAESNRLRERSQEEFRHLPREVLRAGN